MASIWLGTTTSYSIRKLRDPIPRIFMFLQMTNPSALLASACTASFLRHANQVRAPFTRKKFRSSPSIHSFVPWIYLHCKCWGGKKRAKELTLVNQSNHKTIALLPVKGSHCFDCQLLFYLGLPNICSREKLANWSNRFAALVVALPSAFWRLIYQFDLPPSRHYKSIFGFQLLRCVCCDLTGPFSSCVERKSRRRSIGL